MRWRNVKQHKTHTKHSSVTQKPAVNYPPFWKRAVAFGTDIFMIGLPISLLLMMLFGYDALQSPSAMDVLVHDPAAKQAPDPLPGIIQLVLAATIYIAFWKVSGQTPGKKMFFMQIVDATTLNKAPLWKLIIRFLAYFLSFISLIGFFIGLLRKDGRALHDLLSGTAVITVEP